MVLKEVSNIVYSFLSEPATYFWMGLLMAYFRVVEFSPAMTSIYLALLVADIAGWAFLKPKFKFSNVKGNTFNALLIGLLAFSGVVVFSVFADAFMGLIGVDLGLNSVGAVLRHIQVSGGELGLTSQLGTLLIWGFYIPIQETRTLIGWVMVGLSKVFNVPLVFRFSVALIALLFVVSSVFTFFHFKVKGITDSPALAITFVFAFVSGALILHQQELEAAIYTHVLNNGVAVARAFGWLF